jgi:TIR domain-containing protein
MTSRRRTTVGYRYDVFISYRRAGNVERWVQNHLWPVLTECLTDHLGFPPRVFLDTSVRPGDQWPATVRDALRRSRTLLPVLSASYFARPWCRAEWNTFAARERSTAVPAIYPVVHSGLRALPAAARRRTLVDLSPWNFPYPQFRDDARYLGFHRAVETIAEDLAEWCANAPAWSAAWPVRTPARPLAGVRFGC